MAEHIKDYYPPGTEAPPTVKEPYRDYIPGEAKQPEPAPVKEEIRPTPVVEAPKVEEVVAEATESPPAETRSDEPTGETKPRGKRRGPKPKKKK